MKNLVLLAIPMLIMSLPACSAGNDTPPTTGRFKVEAWADNWFALYVGTTLAGEDSVPITTERSFNAETFYFDASPPFDLNLILKDFKQNDTGLEYIGTRNQQMGDGGFSMQITDTTTGRIVAVTGPEFRCLVIHKAPLNPTCEKDVNPEASCQSRIMAEPANWKSADFDASQWQRATVYTADEVGARAGYRQINWDHTARLIWTTDLKTDNTLLCKARISGPFSTLQ